MWRRAARQGNYAFQVIVPIRSLLSVASARNGVGHEKDLDRDLGLFHDGVGMAQRIVSPLRAVWRIIDHKQDLHIGYPLSFDGMCPCSANEGPNDGPDIRFGGLASQAQTYQTPRTSGLNPHRPQRRGTNPLRVVTR